MRKIIKVTAYITVGDKLLVFRYVDVPEAGIQVPAGSVEPGEDLDSAVLREANEETGLNDLKICSYLGKKNYVFDMPGEGEVDIHRHYYHLSWPGPIVEESWRHWELSPSEGERDKVLFELFWVGRDEIPELVGIQGYKLAQLP